VRYVSQYTQQSTGTTLTFGFPLGTGFWRAFANYSYQRVRVTDINTAYTDPLVLARNPYLADSLLVDQNGVRIISKVTPSVIYNSVDQPIFPTTGKKLTLSMDVAGLGGNTSYLKPTVDGVVFLKENSRMTLGLHGQMEYIRPLGNTILPIFEKLFLGGEYSVRGFDLRTIGPMDPQTGLVLGGNKSLLFNVEQIFSIAGPVRLILFYDAGQVRDVGQPFTWQENILRVQPPAVPLLVDPLKTVALTDPSVTNTIINDGSYSAFKTSTGAEIRFFMPVLNVPFRLIFAYNPQRAGVLDSTLQPQKAFQFRFAVGTTF
jgi:outer membrane protein insertion porin family